MEFDLEVVTLQEEEEKKKKKWRLEKERIWERKVRNVMTYSFNDEMLWITSIYTSSFAK